jgi:hypothetical protein
MVFGGALDDASKKISSKRKDDAGNYWPWVDVFLRLNVLHDDRPYYRRRHAPE